MNLHMRIRSNYIPYRFFNNDQGCVLCLRDLLNHVFGRRIFSMTTSWNQILASTKISSSNSSNSYAALLQPIESIPTFQDLPDHTKFDHVDEPPDYFPALPKADDGRYSLQMLSSMDVCLMTSQSKNEEYLMSVIDSKWKSLRNNSSRNNSSRNNSSRNNSSKRYFGSSNKSDVTCQCGHRLRLLTVKKKGPNTGRQFYSCPDKHKSCGHFEWENDTQKRVNMFSGAGSSGSRSFSSGSQSKTYSRPIGNSSGSSSSSGSNDDGGTCKCGKPASLLTVKKEGPNTGKQFYSCNECGHFKWFTGVKKTWQKQSSSSSSGSATRSSMSGSTSGSMASSMPTGLTSHLNIDQKKVIATQIANIDKLTKQVKTLQYQVTTMLGILTNNTNLEENVMGSISDMTEIIQREDNKNNIVIWNVPESEMIEIDEEIREDLELVTEVLKTVDESVTTASLVNESTVSRLGRIKPDVGSKPRAIKVILPDQLIKAKYLNNSRKLITNDIFSEWNIKIVAEKTKKEIEEGKKQYNIRVSEKKGIALDHVRNEKEEEEEEEF